MPDIKTVGLGQRERLTMLFGVAATKLTAATTAGSTTTLDVVDDFGDVLTSYNNSDTVFIVGQDGRREIKTLAGSGAVSASAKTLTLSAAVKYSHAIGTEVWKAATPSTMTLYYLNPAQLASGADPTTKTISDVTTLSTGVLYYDLDMSMEGKWLWWFKGTATVVASNIGDNAIQVIATQTAN